MTVSYNPNTNVYTVDGQEFGSFTAAKSYIDGAYEMPVLSETNDNSSYQTA